MEVPLDVVLRWHLSQEISDATVLAMECRSWLFADGIPAPPDW
jgi:hypothetical protein